MPENRIKAIFDIGLNISKADAEKVQKQIRGLVDTALPKNFRSEEIKKAFGFDGTGKALQSVRGELGRVNKELETYKELGAKITVQKQEELNLANARADTLKREANIQRTRIDASNAEIAAGEKIAGQLKARAVDYRTLNAEQQKHLQTYRSVINARAGQLSSTISAAERAGTADKAPIISTMRRGRRDALKAEIAQLNNLTDVRKLEAADIRRRERIAREEELAWKQAIEQRRQEDKAWAEHTKQNIADQARLRKEQDQFQRDVHAQYLRAERRKEKDERAQAQAERDRLRAEKQQAAEEKRSAQEAKKLREAQAKRARALQGEQALAAVGGPHDVGRASREQLPLITEAMNRRLKVYNDLQDRMIRQGKASTTQFAENQKRIEEYSDAINTANGRMRGFASTLHETALFMRQFIRLGIGFSAVFSIINGVRALAGAVVDLNTQLKSIQAIAAATNQQMETVGGAIKSVAQQTQFSISDVAQSAQLLAQAGVSIADIPKALAATADFASATATDIKTAADLLTTTKDVFKNLDYQGIANELTRTINVSKTNGEDLKVILSTSASTAREFGLAANHYLAAVATLRNAGLKASTVGTGLRRSLMDLFTPKPKTVKVLQKRYEELGEKMTAAEVRGRFYGFKTGRSPVVSALKELQRLGFNSGSGSALLQGGYSTRSRNALSALVSNIGELQKLAPQIQIGNAAMQASQTQMDSLSKSTANLGAALSVLASNMSGNVVPALAGVARELTKVVQDVDKFTTKMRAATGEGIGPSLVGGLLTGVTAFRGSRGGIASRIAKGAVGVGGGALAGMAAPMAGLGSGFNEMISLAIGPVIAKAVTSLTHGFSSAVRVARAGARPGAARAFRASSGAAGEAAGVATGAAEATGAAAAGGTVVKLFSSIGKATRTVLSPLAKLFGPMAKVFAKLAPFAPEIPMLEGAVAGIGAVIDPALGIILAIGGVLGALRLLSGSPSGKDLRNRFKASQDVFRQQVETYNRQLKELSQFQISADSPQNSAARALQDLKNQLQDFNKAKANFLGGTITNLKQVQGLFSQLSAGPGAAQGSPYRKVLLQKLAKNIQVVDSSGQPIKITSQALAANRDAVNSFAGLVSGVSNQTEGLKKSVNDMIGQFRDIPKDALSPFQQAALQAADSLDKADQNLLNSPLAVDPSALATVLTKLFTQTGEIAKKQLDNSKAKDTADLQKQVSEAASLLSSGKLNKTAASKVVQSLVDSAKAAHVNAIDILTELQQMLQAGADSLLKQKKADANYYAPLRKNFGATSKPHGPTGELKTLENARLTSIHGSQTVTDEAKKRLQRELQSDYNKAVNNVSAGLATFSSESQKAAVQKALANPSQFGLQETNAQAFEKLSQGNVGPGSLVSQDATGKTSLDEEYKRAKKFLDNFITTQQKQDKVYTGIYKQDIGLKKASVEAQSRINALRAAGAPYAAQENALQQKYNADKAQLVKQLGFYKDTQHKALLTAKKQDGLDRKIAATQGKIDTLKGKYLQSQLALLKTSHRQEQQQAAALAQHAMNTGNIAEFNAANQAQKGGLASYIANLRKTLAGHASPAEINRKIQQATQGFATTGASPSNAQQTFKLTRPGRELTRLGVRGGYLTGSPYKDALRQQQGIIANNAEIAAADKTRLHDLRKNVEFLKQERALNAKKPSEIAAYDAAIKQLRGDMGGLSGQIQDTSTSLMDQLRKGFNLHQLQGLVERSSSSVKNLGGTIQNDLVNGIDSFSTSLTNAQMNATSVTKAIGASFNALSKQILTDLNKAAANNLIDQLLGKGQDGSGGILHSIIGKAGGFLGTLFGGGAPKLSSAAGSGAGGMAFASGGVIHGPGTGTSDSILARVSNGEAVLTAPATKYLGERFINAVNNLDHSKLPRFANGGIIKTSPTTSASGPSRAVDVQIVNQTGTPAQGKASVHQGHNGSQMIKIVLDAVASDVRHNGQVGQAILGATTASRRVS